MPRASDCPPVSVILADDHPVVLEGLAQLLEREGDIRVLERCTSGTAALEAIQRHSPDVIVLDVHMPGLNGVAVLRELRRIGLDTHVLLLTASIQDEDVLEAIRLGIRGLIPKDTLSDALVDAVRVVARGGTCLDSGVVTRAMARMLTREAALRNWAGLLTPQELRVAQLVVSGLRNRDVAARLFVSEGTVKVHLHHIFEKLNVTSREQLLARARADGLA